MRSRRRAILTAACLALLALAALLLTGASPAAAAEPCPNEALRTGPSANLPDCRAYEQVSPTAKGHADALGAPGYVQASPSGEAVTFFSLSPFPAITPGSGGSGFPTYLANRAATGWSSQGLLPPTDPNEGSQVDALSKDLSQAIVSDSRNEPSLTEEATTGQPNYFLRDSATGKYRLLAPSSEISFADATPGGSRILFESEQHLLAEAPAGKTNLYEWHDGSLSLPGRVPPPGETSCGPSGPACEVAQGSVAGAGASEGHPKSPHYTQHTISTDGSRVFFTDLEDGRLYVREHGETTVAVSAGAGHFRAATPDGRFAFYTEGEKLWRFDVEAETRRELAPSAIGLLGVSDDGSYAYFVDASYQLYEWHEGDEGQPAPTLIAALYGPGGPGVEGAEGDVDDWTDAQQTQGSGPSSGGLKSSLISADGRIALFFHGAALLRWSAPDATLSVIAPNALFGHNELGDAPPARNLFSTRNLSDDGSRVFFQTEEALLPSDTNAQMDVYEWEALGHGSCEESSPSFSQSSGGCLYLISTGTSENASYFGDASASGEDVFFFTRQRLLGQDDDNNLDLYDARAFGGIAAQSPPPPAPICAGEESCRAPAQGAVPPLIPGGSETVGPPNPEPPPACRKGFLRKHGKCVRKAHGHTHHRRAGAKPRAAR